MLDEWCIAHLSHLLGAAHNGIGAVLAGLCLSAARAKQGLGFRRGRARARGSTLGWFYAGWRGCMQVWVGMGQECGQ